jgi:signal peptidase I
MISHSQPESGDVVMFRDPGEGYPVFKRIVGCPGDTIAMHDNLLTINGRLILYEEADPDLDQATRDMNHLGTVVAREIGNGVLHLVTYTPGASSHGTFGPVVVPEGYYFVMGDNRDHSEDSRMYGPIPQDSIEGKVTTLIMFSSNSRWTESDSLYSPVATKVTASAIKRYEEIGERLYEEWLVTHEDLVDHKISRVQFSVARTERFDRPLVERYFQLEESDSAFCVDIGYSVKPTESAFHRINAFVQFPGSDNDDCIAMQE